MAELRDSHLAGGKEASKKNNMSWIPVEVLKEAIVQCKIKIHRHKVLSLCLDTGPWTPHFEESGP